MLALMTLSSMIGGRGGWWCGGDGDQDKGCDTGLGREGEWAPADASFVWPGPLFTLAVCCLSSSSGLRNRLGGGLG